MVNIREELLELLEKIHFHLISSKKHKKSYGMDHGTE
jgi:hypothetical protein